MEQSARRHRGPETNPDEETRLLAWIYRRPLTTTKTDTCCLRRNNAKALRLATEQSEREVKEAAAEKTREKFVNVCLQSILCFFVADLCCPSFDHV